MSRDNLSDIYENIRSTLGYIPDDNSPLWLHNGEIPLSPVHEVHDLCLQLTQQVTERDSDASITHIDETVDNICDLMASWQNQTKRKIQDYESELSSGYLRVDAAMRNASARLSDKNERSVAVPNLREMFRNALPSESVLRAHADSVRAGNNYKNLTQRPKSVWKEAMERYQNTKKGAFETSCRRLREYAEKLALTREEVNSIQEEISNHASRLLKDLTSVVSSLANSSRKANKDGFWLSTIQTKMKAVIQMADTIGSYTSPLLQKCGSLLLNSSQFLQSHNQTITTINPLIQPHKSKNITETLQYIFGPPNSTSSSHSPQHPSMGIPTAIPTALQSEGTNANSIYVCYDACGGGVRARGVNGSEVLAEVCARAALEQMGRHCVRGWNDGLDRLRVVRCNTKASMSLIEILCARAGIPVICHSLPIFGSSGMNNGSQDIWVVGPGPTLVLDQMLEVDGGGNIQLKKV